MLTRRSRREADASLNDVSPKNVSQSKKSTSPRKTPKKTPKKTKTSTSGNRSISRSVDRKIMTRSKSVDKSAPIKSTNSPMPYVVITKYDQEETEKLLRKSKRSVKPIDTKLRKSPTPVIELINQRISPSVERESNVSAVSRSLYDSESDGNEPKFELNHKNITYKEEDQFGGTLANFILSTLLPILVILAHIGLKAQGNLIPFPQGYLRLTNYYDQNVFIWSAAIVLVQLLISVVPLAKKNSRITEYCKWTSILQVFWNDKFNYRCFNCCHDGLLQVPDKFYFRNSD